MKTFGLCNNRNRNFQISRRRALEKVGLGFGSLASLSLLANPEISDAYSQPIDSPPTHFKPRVKRVLFLFMHGGPSHLDTFDYKPLLQKDSGKPLPYPKPRVQFAKTGNLMKSPFDFKRHGQSGAWVSSIFPNVAKHVDKLCLVKAMHGTNAAHGGALLKLHTGSESFVRPSMGSWISYGLGTENANLPSFITICPTLGHGGVRNFSASFLPGEHQGTPLGNSGTPASSVNVHNIKNMELDSVASKSRLDLIQKLNQLHSEDYGFESELDARIKSFELAFRMQSEAPGAMHWESESTIIKNLYGIGNSTTKNFGIQCLMARRLLESGVRFVQVSHSYKWDQHSNLKKLHSKNALEVDQPISGLLTDLESRGLLDDTLVIWGGEFGRTPTAQGSDGRDHNPHAFTIWMAGGGVKPGISYGETDDYGFYTARDAVDVHDFHATILAALGMDHQKLTYRYAGRDFRLTDVHGRIIWDILKT